MGLADAILNVGFFIPVGVAFGYAFGWRRAIPLAVLASASVETLQLVVPGRHSSLGDLTFNATGAAVGAAVLAAAPRLLRPGASLAAALAAAWSILAVGVLVGAYWLLQPDLPRSIYFGQWAARLENMEHYDGVIHSVRLGGIPVGTWRLEDSDSVRLRLARGTHLEVTMTAGRPTRATAPLFSIADEAERRVLLLGVDGDDLVYHYRQRAARIRLDQPSLRFPGAFANVRPGDRVRVQVEPQARGGYRLRVDDVAVTDRVTLADSWGLLLWPGRLAAIPAFRTLAAVLWLVVLVGPALAWAIRAATVRRTD